MRRSIYLLSAVALLLSLVGSACGPTPTPQVIKETVVVEKEVEVEVTKEVVVTPTPLPPPEEVLKWKISIMNVHDSYVVDPDLKSSTGFACVIKTPGTDILFDTGYYPSGDILLSNMEKMNIDPKDIDIVVISHQHLDKGLAGFLKQNANVKVYVPASYPEYTRSMVEEYGAEYLEVSEFSEITENIYSTGAMEGKGYRLTEQSLVIDTEKGLVVILGCAHPGIVDILKKIKEMLPDKDFYLVMGGFHLKSVSEAELESVIKEFKKLGVKKVAPSHCSGDSFRELSKRKYKNNYIEGGVGQIISF